MTLDVDKVASGTSPLQRLKALTQSDVVNHGALPPSTRTSAVVSFPAAALPIKIVSPPSYDGRSLNSTSQRSQISTAEVRRYGGASVCPSATVSLSASAVPIKVVSPPSYDGRRLDVTLPKAVPLPSRSAISTISAADVRRFGSVSACPRRGGVVVGPLSYDEGTSDATLMPLPLLRSQIAAAEVRRFGGVPACPRRGGSRPVCLELDDHRYSSTVVPRTAAKPCRADRRSSVDARRPSVKSRPPPTSPSSSVLEVLLRTSKRLRPNDGSDVTLAACCRPAKRPPHTSRRRAPPPAPTPLGQPAIVDEGPALPLASLPHARPASAPDDAAAAATTSSTLAVAPPGELSGDSFSLFSEHLLCDSHGIIDVGLLTDDQPAWTPSRLDDKVTQLDFTLCFSINSTPSGRKRNQFFVCSLF